MVKRRINRQQFWEIIIIILIVLLMIYRLALVYDFVPDAYQPSSILANTYIYVKKIFVTESKQENILGHTAKWTVDHLNIIEKNLHDQKMRYIRSEEVSERCHENMIFRYFNFMGDEDNPNCSEQNMQLQHATKEIMDSNKKNPPGTAPATITNTATPNTTRNTAPEAIPSSGPPVTTIQVQGRIPLTPEMVAPTPVTPAPTPVTPVPTPVTPAPSPVTTSTPVNAPISTKASQPTQAAPIQQPIAPPTSIPQQAPQSDQRPHQEPVSVSEPVSVP